jgi:hypothetical protein
MQFITQLVSKTGLCLIIISALGCSSATVEPERIDIKNPGPKTQNYTAAFPNVWKSCLIVLGKYPLKSYDEDSGIIETDFIRGEDVWVAPHRKKYVVGGYRYKLNLRVIKGRTGNKNVTKVIINKLPELQKDFFADTEKVQSDGLEEMSLLYRIERELAIDQALSKVQRTK